MARRLHDVLFSKQIDFLMLLLPRELHDAPIGDLVLYAQRRKALSVLLYGAPDATPGGPHDVSDRVAVFGITNDFGNPVYVHCKLMVVDDIWSSISSSNLSRRSMTYDSEIGVMSIHKQTRRGGQRMARQLRIDLLSAHLGLAPEERSLVEDPYHAFRLVKDYLDGNLTGRTLNVEKFGIAEMDIQHTHYGVQPAEADGTFIDAVNLIADPDGEREILGAGLFDLQAVMEALDGATQGNVFGGLGSLRLTFDVSAIGDPNDILVDVSVLELGKPEVARVGLGKFAATASVNAGLVKTGSTYRVRGIASLEATPGVELARQEVNVTSSGVSSQGILVFTAP
jgi:hypothetical protein